VPETTKLILDTLRKRNIKAAFFCVGENVDKYPGLYEQILKEGHFICNHTYNHSQLLKLSKNEVIEQIEKFNNLIKQNSGKDVLYFRPPYGKFDLSIVSLLKEMNLKTVMWSLITYDYKNNIDEVKFSVERYLMENSIIVLHDSLKSKDIIVESINYIIEETSHKGFQIGAPAECLR
jgi:peptidoglycan/xylan/chitin deacetylase (PgdA/CDA1 family)